MTTLKRLLPSQDVDSLLGDIAEEAPRRSRLWYWAQLLAVVVVTSCRDARRHPWLALRAIATGFAALALYFRAVLLIGRVVVVLSNGGYYIAGHWLTLPYPPPPYDALTVVAIDAIGFALSGWTIVRFHRAQGIAMAVPFAFLSTLAGVVLLGILATDTGPGTRVMSLPQFVALFGTMFASIPVGILAGGMLGLRWKRP